LDFSAERKIILFSCPSLGLSPAQFRRHGVNDTQWKFSEIIQSRTQRGWGRPSSGRRDPLPLTGQSREWHTKTTAVSETDFEHSQSPDCQKCTANTSACNDQH